MPECARQPGNWFNRTHRTPEQCPPNTPYPPSAKDRSTAESNAFITKWQQPRAAYCGNLAVMDQDLRGYELVLENGRSSSPYVWRIRYALAHKGLSANWVPLGFIEIPQQFGGRFKTVPVIEHGEVMLAESWDIAEYLDSAFPDRPAIFSGPAEKAMVQLYESWFSTEILRNLFRIYILDVCNAARPEDRRYFRESREKMVRGVALEVYTADRASRLPALRDALRPMRTHLSRHPFLGGTTSNYADYIALGAFQWVASVSTLPLLARDDEIMRAWLERGFGLFGGIGRDDRLRPLFE